MQAVHIKRWQRDYVNTFDGHIRALLSEVDKVGGDEKVGAIIMNPFDVAGLQKEAYYMRPQFRGGTGEVQNEWMALTSRFKKLVDSLTFKSSPRVYRDTVIIVMKE
jgi:hypothetical protein